ncbi:RICIN domain-containing protein [Micromonospora deserti]|nr:RICIN domain-containing protein [Micromonospora deserti]
MQQYTCHAGTNQQYQLQDAGSGYVRMVARHSGTVAA